MYVDCNQCPECSSSLEAPTSATARNAEAEGEPKVKRSGRRPKVEEGAARMIAKKNDKSYFSINTSILDFLCPHSLK